MKRVLFINDTAGSVTAQIIEGLFIAAREYGYEYEDVHYLKAFRKVNEDTIPLFIRSCCSANIALAEYFKLCNVPYVYYIDDDLWHIESYANDADLIHTLDTLIANAACVLVNSEILAEEVSRRNAMVHLLPTFYDFNMLNGVEQDFHPGEVRIGFPSNCSRLPDIEPLVPVIQRLLNCYQGKIVFEFVGVIPPELRSLAGVRYFEPICDYVEFSKFQFSRAWDIGLAPLRPTIWNYSKTNNKYREYGACGVAGVYSDVPPYSCVQHRHTGFMVGDSGEDWFDAISELIEDPHLRRACGQNAHQDVRERFSIDVALPEWITAVNSISNISVGSFRQMAFPWNSVFKAWSIHGKYRFSQFLLYLHTFGTAKTFRKIAERLWARASS